MGLPVEVNNLMMGSLGGYNIGRSLRFRSSASAYLSRTPSVAGNQQKWTWSGWVKRGKLGANQPLLTVDDGTYYFEFGFNSSDQIIAQQADAAWANNYGFITVPVYRDPSAWYHVILAVDTTQATAANRMLLYINGVAASVTAGTGGSSTYITQNYNTYVNRTIAHQIQSWIRQSWYDDGYLAEVNFIDGQQLTPSSFGAYDTNGVWQPKKYTGTYGTNGFYLPFSNTTSTTTLVADSSGNGNNWTPNNISLTAGTTYDSMIDSPTVSASASNYATLNPLDSAGGVISDGNLSATQTATGRKKSTIGVSSGKWYWEVTAKSSGDLMIGASSVTLSAAGAIVGSAANDYGYYSTNGQKYTNGTSSAYGATYTTNDVIGVALDLNSGTITFYKNNTSQGTAFTGVSGTLTPAVSSGGAAGASFAINFGQQPFTYTPPTGFNALNTYNLPEPSIANGAQYMAATLWTGTGATNTISNSASSGGNNPLGKTFYPDFTWIKQRNSTGYHNLVDTIRGAGNVLASNSTDPAAQIGHLTAFTSTGFTLDTNSDVNASGSTYVGWQWNAGSGSTVSNTSGSITSTVSANPTAGFSIVTFSGIGANATVGHGLNSAPSMIIAKVRNGTGGWPIYHANLASPAYFLELQSTNGQVSSPTVWNSTAPTSSVFSIGSAFNNVSNYVAYCFSAVSGYSSFGVYTGNGSSTDGPFIYTGFRPRFLMIKRIDAADDWPLEDTSRNTYNLNTQYLLANSSAAEGTVNLRDFLSNGFKVRATAQNTNGGTYVYAAFAENPFKYSRAR